MIANQCARLCMKVVPSAAPEYYFKPVDQYDSYNFKMILQKYTAELLTKDVNLRTAINEITHYIVNSSFEQDFAINQKSGVIFFHNGYPFMGFANKIALILPNSYYHAVIIDINNFIFNKNIMTQLRDKQRAERKAKEQKEVAIVLTVVFIIIVFFIHLVKWWP